MKKQCKLSILTLVLVSIFLLSIVNIQNYSTQQGNDERSVETRDQNKLESPKISGTYLESFIHIDGNWSAAEGEDWCYGDGSWGNPYIIENVTIDASSSSTGSGIFINNSKTEYFIIRNCNITNAGSGTVDAGIKLENTNNGTITNNNCSNNGRIGIYLVNSCENNTISGNVALNNNIRGICLENNCDDNIISGNTASNDDTSKQNNGIYIRNGCDDNTITENTANNNSDNGIILFQECDNNSISGNTANNNDYRGIYLDDDCDNNTLSGNTASNDDTSKQNNGIYIRNGCDDNTITGNTANNNSDNGIYLEDHCDYNTISGNTANNNDYGIYIELLCDDNTISGNTANNNDYGIYLELICNDNTISGNNVIYNDKYGISLTQYSGYSCDNNLLYYNAFIDNGIHANDDGTNNEWDNSEIGNYWDNCTAPDSNNNGIVDNPYTWITGSANSKDSFPLTGIPIHLGEKIHIDDTGVSAWNWSKTAKLKAWCSGTGIYSDPYLIDGVEINGSGSGDGILIGNSSVYFTIENCKIYNALNGITLENTGNGTLTQNNCSNNNHRGIWLHDNCRNNTLLDNTANSNSIVGIILEIDCDNNTISDNIACGPYQNNGIHLIDECDHNNISLNTLNDNHDYGIYLDDECDNNTISGNTANDNDKYGIFLAWYCDNNTISGNTANDNDQQGMSLARNCNHNSFSGNTINDNGDYGIYLIFDCIDNRISGNTINDNGDYGIYLIFVCNKSNISDNYLYFNTNGAIWIVQANCEDTIIERNVMVSENKNFIIDDGTNTYIDGNLYLTSPSLCIEIVNQSFSTTEFNIIIRIFDSFNFSDILFDGFDLGLYYYFHIESIEMWWNGTVVPSINITDLGHGLYNISLTPILVEPGDDPILLNMTISATHHLDQFFERYFAVDPEAVDKEPKSEQPLPTGGDGGGGGGSDGEKGAELEVLTVILLIVGIASAIGLTGVVLFFIKKRKGIENR